MLTTHAERPVGRILLAFAIIYFVWGSTYFAIRVGVHAMPPLTMAALRLVFSGIVLVGWQISRGEKLPVRREWAAATFLGFLMFVCGYGLLFWAEQTVPSGAAAVVLSTIPVFMAVFEVLFLRTQRFTLRLVFAFLVGIAGVVALMSKTLNLADAPIDRFGTMALIFAAMTWSISSVITRKLPLPTSKLISSGVQMLAGGVLLIPAAGIFGEFGRFHPATVSFGAWMALLYLIVFGSIIGFTAFVWLLHHESPTKVGTYAYVNPVIAVIVGSLLGGEPLGARTVIGTACVLVSVVVITCARVAMPAPPVQHELAERQ
jgi:drug/metabolite transporter (DMT)-like permease